MIDLGSGGGFDVFVAAQKVGENGRAIGVDMTDVCHTCSVSTLESADLELLSLSSKCLTLPAEMLKREAPLMSSSLRLPSLQSHSNQTSQIVSSAIV